MIENWTHPLMTSSLAEIMLPQRPPGMPCPTVVTGGDRRSLFVALEAVSDPRDLRGRRYPLVAILAAAVCAVIAGACTFAAVSDWVRFQDRAVWARLGFEARVPAATTVWRLLIRIDAEALSQVLARWLQSRTAPVPAGGHWWRRVIAVDGKVARAVFGMVASARKMADLYGVASMTAQRALRELQNRRITYSAAGKGTFVHPDAFDLLRGGVMQEPIADPGLRGRVAAYLTEQQAITRRFHAARTPDDRNAALNDLVQQADTHGQLIDDVIKYHADHGNYATPPAHMLRDDVPDTAEDEPTSKPPTAKRTRRPRKPTT
ncbi:transposase family protein [Paractinoplanes brasiliensis]|uniref:transposase family protein n=1 Tax=Paractinoplanes brasiliensis TaxID=52695 RepID=UPI00194597B5|nr:transposase family protein [Actinoplanes brasiliensis]